MFLFLIVLMILGLFYFVMLISSKYEEDKEKLSIFECGFDALSSPRSPFSIQFFKILVIFLLFDMEILIVLPFPLYKLNYLFNIFFLLLILLFLIFGLLYEWKEGSLDWLY
uniref:NADH-ubiquinone oxidoreductase chain 3 n=1 Tax=Galendromus occidentalis TaxID=34638 RepID=D5IEF4_9ACAR|nr:NADH dehydrogenase subunit 3 [Galendromus occidentalis]